MEDSDVDGEIEDLLAYFEQQLTMESSFPKICTNELDMTQMHISGKITLFDVKKLKTIIILMSL